MTLHGAASDASIMSVMEKSIFLLVKILFLMSNFSTIWLVGRWLMLVTQHWNRNWVYSSLILVLATLPWRQHHNCEPAFSFNYSLYYLLNQGYLIWKTCHCVLLLCRVLVIQHGIYTRRLLMSMMSEVWVALSVVFSDTFQEHLSARLYLPQRQHDIFWVVSKTSFFPMQDRRPVISGRMKKHEFTCITNLLIISLCCCIINKTIYIQHN